VTAVFTIHSGHEQRQIMPDTSRRTAEDVLRTYFHSKDENRPHLMAGVFSETATLETIVKTGAISFPPLSRGLAPITEVLVRRFAQAYENVYSFYLERPASQIPSASFSCDWLVGMSEKETGNARVGCGRYDWRFQSDEPHLADRLVITIEAMQVLSPASLEPVLGWLTELPYPWCPAETLLATAPAIGDLAPVFRYVGRRSAV
jgi:hypothetical protein